MRPFYAPLALCALLAAATADGLLPINAGLAPLPVAEAPLEAQRRPWPFRPKRPTPAPGGGGGGDVTDDPLVQSTDFTFLGRFSVTEGSPSWRYGAGQGMGLSAGGTHLYMGGYGGDVYLGQLPISGSPSTTTTGPFVTQSIAPTSIGSFGAVGGSDPGETLGFVLGGSLVYNNRLLVSVYSYYDAESNAQASHYVCTTSITSCTGAYAFDEQAGWTGGPMGLIPEGWRTLLGGPALVGLNSVPIIARTSYGPNALVFNPDDVGVTAPVPSQILLGYDGTHTTLGPWAGNGVGGAVEQWNGAMISTAIAFVPNTRSVLFIGRGGAGDFCYGTGTANPALHRTDTGTGHIYCYDPDFAEEQGNHDYPYDLRVWAYDANDLAAVKAGTMAYWEPVPYATWSLDADYVNVAMPARVASGTFDPATNRLYVSANTGDGNFAIHVWQIAVP
jgi:hypothetical protein